jgi:hypothetical protein
VPDDPSPAPLTGTPGETASSPTSESPSQPHDRYPLGQPAWFRFSRTIIERSMKTRFRNGHLP